MNGFDIALLVFAGVLVVLGMVKGLVRILIGIAALVAAFALAAYSHAGLAAKLGVFEAAPEVRGLIAWMLIFIGVLLAGALVARLARGLVKAALLGWADRLGGAAVGFAAAVIAAALVVVPVVAYTPLGDGLLSGSLLAPYVTVVSDLANRLVPDELSQKYRTRIEDLRRHWRDVGASL
jgi:membrane protein required for colicin V production